MIFWGNTLEWDVIFLKCIFELLIAFIVQNVDLYSVPVGKQLLVCGFPCSANTGCLPVG